MGWGCSSFWKRVIFEKTPNVVSFASGKLRIAVTATCCSKTDVRLEWQHGVMAVNRQILHRGTPQQVMVSGCSLQYLHMHVAGGVVGVSTRPRPEESAFNVFCSMDSAALSRQACPSSYAITLRILTSKSACITTNYARYETTTSSHDIWL